MDKKYKLTSNKKEHFGRTLYQIEALKDFGDVLKGDKGGYIEKEANLSQEDKAWVYGNANVYGEAQVYGNAQVSGEARVFDNFKLQSGRCFARKCEDWDITELKQNDGSILLIKDCVLGEEEKKKKHVITIDGKDIELSEESFNNLKEQLND